MSIKAIIDFAIDNGALDDENLRQAIREAEEQAPWDAYDKAMAEQAQPVAVWELQASGWEIIADADWVKTLPFGTKLYTSPPQRKPLTDEEIQAVIARIDPDEQYLPNALKQFARAIEAAHGIKEKT